MQRTLNPNHDEDKKDLYHFLKYMEKQRFFLTNDVTYRRLETPTSITYKKITHHKRISVHKIFSPEKYYDYDGDYKIDDGEIISLSHQFLRFSEYVDNKKIYRYVVSSPTPILKRVDLKKPPENFIGHGAYAAVYRADYIIELSDETQSIVKIENCPPIVIKVQELEYGDLCIESHKRENFLTRKIPELNTKKITFTRGSKHKKNASYIIMNELTHKTLTQYLTCDEDENEFTIKENLTFANRLTIAKNLAEKLDQYHTLNIRHNDLKPDNILVTNDFNVFIIDLGLAIEKLEKLYATQGTPIYSSPEMIFNPETIDEKSDIYNYGCILKLLFGDEERLFLITNAGSINGGDFYSEMEARLKNGEYYPLDISPKIKNNLTQENLKILDDILNYSTHPVKDQRWSLQTIIEKLTELSESMHLEKKSALRANSVFNNEPLEKKPKLHNSVSLKNSK